MPASRRTSRSRWFLAALLSLLLPIIVSSGADAALLRGRVISREGARPVDGAVVRLLETGRALRTSADGTFAFEDLAAGQWTISVHHVAFADEERVVVLGSDTDASLLLTLRTAIHPTGEVIVRSARSTFSLRRSPWAAGVRSADELADHPAVTPSEQAAAVPGVALVRDGAWQTAVSIRGMSRSNVVALVDHTRIETANDIAGALSLVDGAELERIEVLKSPGSVLFGSGCLGGAISLVTKRAAFGERPAFGGELTESVSSVDGGIAHHLSAEHSTTRTALRVGGGYRDAGNTATARGDVPNSQYTDWNASASLGVRTRGEQSLFGSWQRSQAENTGIPGGAPFSATATATYRLARRERFALEYALPHLAPRLALLTVRVSRQEIARNVELLQSPTVTVTPHATHETNSAQVESRLLPAAGHVLALGVEGWQRRLDSRRERTLKATNRVIGERPVPGSSQGSAGLYAQDDWDALPGRARVVFGARHDWNRTRNDRTLNPDYVIIGGVRQDPTPGQTVLWEAGHSRDASWDASVGVHATLGPHAVARLLGATAFRSPSLEERFQYLDLGSSLYVGNPNLQPERSRSVNAGGRVTLGGTSLDADVFLNTLTDMVSEIPGTFGGRAAFVKTNIGRARLYGWELAADQRLGARFALAASAASVRGEDTQNHTQLPQIAPLSGRAELSALAGPAGTWRVAVVAAAAQDRPAPGEAATAGWTAWSAHWASAPLRVAGVSCRARAGIDNAFDRAYRQHLSTLRGLVRLEAGRNVTASLTASF